MNTRYTASTTSKKVRGHSGYRSSYRSGRARYREVGDAAYNLIHVDAGFDQLRDLQMREQ